jgi:hypothetical protein
MKPTAPMAVLLLVALGGAGCSTFNADFEKARTAAPDSADPAPSAPMLGAWEGTWLSAENGHTGGLRSIASALPDGRVEARYHATYGWFFTFEYTVPMTVDRDGAACRFQGSADLGWMAGGMYTYDGRVEGDTFRCEYRSGSDHGTFTMSRPK